MDNRPHHAEFRQIGIRASKQKPYLGLYLAGLVWAGDCPFVTDLQDVMEGCTKERKEYD